MKDIWRFLVLYRPCRWRVLAGVALAVVTLLAGVALMAISGWFIASMALAGAAGIGMNYFAPAAAIRGLSIARTAGRYGERVVSHDTALRVTTTFRVWLYSRMEPGSVMDIRSADLFRRLRADIDSLERFYLQGLLPFVTAILALAVACVALAFYNPALAALIVIMNAVLGVAVPFMMQGGIGRGEQEIARERAGLTVDLDDMWSGMAEIVIYGQAKKRIAGVQARDRMIGEAARAIQRRENLLQMIIVGGAGLGIAGAIFIVGPGVGAGIVNPADLAMVALLSMASFDIVQPLPLAIRTFYSVQIAARRIFEIIDRNVVVDRARTIDPAAEFKNLTVEDVSFSYSELPLLRGLDFNVAPGDVVVFQGESGAGKSTLIDLITGWRRPMAGRILINGIDTADYDEEFCRRFFTVSSQRPYLFADTVRANLCLGNPAAADAEIADICFATGLDEVIAAMPYGLDTYIGERGMRLSGGQVRRLSLARALLRPAPVLLLDEPAEGLDEAMENIVMGRILAVAAARRQAVIIGLHESHKAWLPATARTVRICDS